jgi:O-antigen/teichoic acid export membrane protein
MERPDTRSARIANRVVFAVLVNWLSRATVIALGLVLIPLLFRKLGREEVGLWFMLGQSGAFLALMDLGISATFTRRIAFATAAASGDAASESRRELANLIATGRTIYRYMTILVFIVALLTGLWFLHLIELHEVSRSELWTAWTIMCLSHALGVWASIWSCVLQGTGHVGWDGLVAIGIQVLTLVLQLLAVWLGGGLITLATIAAAGALATRWSVYQLIRIREPRVLAERGAWDPAVFRSIVPAAFRAWLTGLGAFLILKTDQYFIAYYKGSAQIPDYHAAYQLVSNLMMLSMSFAVASQVFISQSWRAGRYDEVRSMFERNLRFGLILMSAGIAYLLTNGADLIGLWLGSEHFIGYPILAVFCVTLFLETQHSAIAAASRSTEDEVFAVAALVAGCLNLVLTWILLKRFGLLGVALGTMLAQMLTNNWYAVYRGLKRLRISFASYLRHVLLPVAAGFAMVLLAAEASSHAVSGDGSRFTRVMGTLGASALASCAALWLFALDPRGRSSLLARFRRANGKS